MAEREMPRHEPCREIGLPLPVKSVEQGGTDFIHIGRQVVEVIVSLTWNLGRWHIEITRKVLIRT